MPYGNNNRGDEKSDKTKNTFILFSFFCEKLYYVADYCPFPVIFIIVF